MQFKFMEFYKKTYNDDLNMHILDFVPKKSVIVLHTVGLCIDYNLH